jgi:hypothetical protein
VRAVRGPVELNTEKIFQIQMAEGEAEIQLAKVKIGHKSAMDNS